MGGEGLVGAPWASEVHGDLMMLLQHETGQSAQPLLEALLDKRSGGDPPAIRDAADRLLKRHLPGAVDMAPAAAALIRAAGDERSQRLYVTFCLHRDGRSQGQLGRQEGISATRVGQIIQGAERQVRLALADSRGSLPWAVRSLRRQLGGVTTEGHLDAMLARMGAGERPAAELLPWLAGPYLPVPGRPGWLAVESRPVVLRTTASLRADGGVRRLTDVRAELADLEIDERQLVLWLQANGATVIHDLVVGVGGPLADAVERVLDAHGEPRTAGAIAADLADGGRTVDLSSLRVAIRQRRFARVGNSAIRLAAWPEGDQPDLKGRRRRRPDRARRPRSSPSPGVRMPAADEPSAVAPGARGTATGKSEPVASEVNRWWLRVQVDTDVLRGREAAVPVGLVEGLGLAPLTRCTFSSRWGPVTLAYERPQPTRGSVRAIALAAGARADDILLLGFSGSAHDVAVQVRPGSALIDPPEGLSVDVTLFPEVATGGPR